MSVTFTVMGEPVAKERPRVVGSHTYTPEKTLAHELLIANAFANKSTRAWDKASKYRVDCYFCCRLDNKDIDNMIKTVLDGLIGKAWKNDKQVLEVWARKVKATAVRNAPHTTVTVTQL